MSHTEDLVLTRSVREQIRSFVDRVLDDLDPIAWTYSDEMIVEEMNGGSCVVCRSAGQTVLVVRRELYNGLPLAVAVCSDERHLVLARDGAQAEGWEHSSVTPMRSNTPDRNLPHS